MADYGELGTFSTEYPWSDVMGTRPAIIPDHPDSIQTYFSFGFSLISVNKFSGSGIICGSPNHVGTLSGSKSVLKKLNGEILNKPADFKYGKP